MAAKEATQEAFLQTFIALFQAKKRIVIASSLSPRELVGFEERLLSRFEGGLVVEMKPTDLESRLTILKKKAEIYEIAIPDEVIHFLAVTNFGNVRALEGMLIRLGTYSSLTLTPISIEMARDLAGDLMPGN